MLLASGFKPEQIVIQRLTTGDESTNTDNESTNTDNKGNNYVYNSHAAIYVLLEDGSVVIPDMTIPFKQADYYNVKVGNDTSGFIFLDKEQVEILSEDYEIWNEYNEKEGIRDTVFYPVLENLDGKTPELSKTYENVINECGSYFYGFVLADPKKQDKVKLAQEKTFFTSLNDSNKDVIDGIDKKLNQILLKVISLKKKLLKKLEQIW